MSLSSPVKATIADASGTGTITDDDPMPSLSINDSSGAEGGARSFTVSLSVPSGQQVRVDYTTADGTATAPGDYTTKSATLVFQPGQTSKPVSVSTTGDALDEDDETFKVNLSNQINATISDGSGTGTITDDDPTPTLSIDDVRRSEGANPQRFTISLSAVSGRRVQVEYATANGTAVAPGDYGSKSGSVTFQPGQTTKTVTVNSVDDALDEPDESFTVNLSNPSNATIGDGVGHRDDRRQRSGRVLDRAQQAAVDRDRGPGDVGRRARSRGRRPGPRTRRAVRACRRARPAPRRSPSPPSRPSSPPGGPWRSARWRRR